MKCPVCDVALSISSREGVEIDFCPQCRGVWLDRGELDKIIERAAVEVGGRRAPDPGRRPAYEEPPRYEQRPGYGERPRYEPGPGYDDRSRYEERERYDRKRKRRSFLDDLFDFD